MRSKAILVGAGEVALALLKLTVASSDWNPPLKAATGGALHIVELIKVSVDLISSRFGLLTISLGFSITSQRVERVRRLHTEFDGMGYSDSPRYPSHTRRHQTEFGDVTDVSTCGPISTFMVLTNLLVHSKGSRTRSRIGRRLHRQRPFGTTSRIKTASTA
jgi:hypothetical protein